MIIINVYYGTLDEMLKIAREDNTPELFIQALGDVTRSKGMSEAAREIQVNRESLYKSLSEKGNPSFSIIFKILDFLNLRLSNESPRPNFGELDPP